MPSHQHDITPTWRGVLPLLLEAYSNGTDKGRADAIKELYRMADLADEAVKTAKQTFDQSNRGTFDHDWNSE